MDSLKQLKHIEILRSPGLVHVPSVSPQLVRISETVETDLALIFGVRLGCSADHGDNFRGGGEPHTVGVTFLKTTG